MIGGMNFLRKIVAPVGLAALAVMVFSGCVAEVEMRRGRYYSDRIWHSDPYCRYGSSWGCRYYGHDGARLRVIQSRRWGRFEPVANVEATKRTNWKSEFNLNNRTVEIIQSAWLQALDRQPESFYALGFTRSDARALANFKMPKSASVARAAYSLGVEKQDLADFLEVFTIRMKAAFAANEQYR